MMSRLDVYLCEHGIAKSRERAKNLIKGGKVNVNGSICTKPAYEVGENDEIAAQPDDLKYVGRGGLKLAKAFEVFDLNVDGAVCADIGASTGGFTQCLLEHDAKTVYAVDVGHSQLDESLLNDRRVVNCEGVNARDLTSDSFPKRPSFISVDVSFISLELIIGALSSLLDENGEIVALIKPQFEAGKKALNKKGIVKDQKDHIRVLEKLVCAFNSADLTVNDIIPSSITGGDGNIEYLAYMRKEPQAEIKSFDLDRLVKSAFLQFK